jgi:outer membrane lipoprotein-sorting protein
MRDLSAQRPSRERAFTRVHGTRPRRGALCAQSMESKRPGPRRGFILARNSAGLTAPSGRGSATTSESRTEEAAYGREFLHGAPGRNRANLGRLVLGGLALAVLVFATPLRADSLSEVLARMDRAAKNFMAVTADVKRIDYTAVLDESKESSGTMALRRTKNGNELLVKFSEPDPYDLELSGHTAKKYSPRANTVEIYDTNKLASAEKVMLAGFGVSAADLGKDYDIKLVGPENIGSVPTTHIELTPKSADVRKSYAAKIDLWIPDGQANPIREKLTAPSKDYNLWTYSNLKVNPPLPDSAFRLNLPSGVKELHPQ